MITISKYANTIISCRVQLQDDRSDFCMHNCLEINYVHWNQSNDTGWGSGKDHGDRNLPGRDFTSEL